MMESWPPYGLMSNRPVLAKVLFILSKENMSVSVYASWKWPVWWRALKLLFKRSLACRSFSMNWSRSSIMNRELSEDGWPPLFDGDNCGCTLVEPEEMDTVLTDAAQASVDIGGVIFLLLLLVIALLLIFLFLLFFFYSLLLLFIF